MKLLSYNELENISGGDLMHNTEDLVSGLINGYNKSHHKPQHGYFHK